MAQKKGSVFLILWATLILAGIVAKRGYGHPNMVIFFHLPAAVFLVLGWHALSANYRKRYRESLVRQNAPIPRVNVP
jgi:hypothetical protein